MRRWGRIVGALLVVGSGVACASSRAEAPGVTNLQPEIVTPPACFAPGEHCVWDQQCCSGRCYEDTGCSG
jgi:hypothetical protein